MVELLDSYSSARIKLETLVVWTVATEFVWLDYAYSEYMRGLGGQVWMIGCLSFCWLSFFVCIVVHVVRRREKARDKLEKEIVKTEKERGKRTGERTFSISDHHPVSLFLHTKVLVCVNANAFTTKQNVVSFYWIQRIIIKQHNH